MSDNSSMQFLFGDRELWLGVKDPLAACVDVIVGTTDNLLVPADEIARRIHDAAGVPMQQEKAQLLKEHGEIASGMALYTTAGDLSFKSLIYAVIPFTNDDDQKGKITQAVSNSLLLCETNDWTSIAFPAICVDHSEANIATSSQAFYHAITRFWDARFDCSVTKIMLCLTEQSLQPFFHAFREQAHIPETEVTAAKEQKQEEQSVGYVDLSVHDADGTDDEIEGWFK
jgi:O-acetyl-ADP-ribose deacetylase (regulator of RNase III)